MPLSTPPDFVPALRLDEAFSGPRYHFAVLDQKVLVSADGSPPHLEALSELSLSVEAEHILGLMRGTPCVATLLSPSATAPEGMRFVDLRTLLASGAGPFIGVAARAVQIAEWERTHRFCGACGRPTRTVETRRAKRCDACRLEAFPRLAPAVIVAVEREGQILLARGPHFPPGIHSCLAGFVDPGESAEEAVHREIFEEVGLHIQNLRYFASQPWPFPHSLMLGFHADYAGGEIRIDGDEIVSAGFFSPDALPPLFPGQVSISQWLLRDFLERNASRG